MRVLFPDAGLDMDCIALHYAALRWMGRSWKVDGRCGKSARENTVVGNLCHSRAVLRTQKGKTSTPANAPFPGELLGPSDIAQA